MKTFRYKVMSRDGESSVGTLEATDIKKAGGILRSKGFLITNLEEDTVISLSMLTGRVNKPKDEEITNFTRQFSTMLSAGLPLVDALRLLRNQSSPTLMGVLDRVLVEVEGGTSLADAMESTGGMFSKVYISLVRAGESAGVLDEVLRKVSDNLEKQREFRSKTKGAMIYPAIIFTGMIVIVAIMMIFVLPRLTTMYDDMGIEMPMMTQILIGTSNFMVKNIVFLLGLAFGGFLMFNSWRRTEVGALVIEQLMFKIPIWGKLKKDLIITEFARTIGILLSAGISILDALLIVADTLGSTIYETEVKQIASKVEKGVPFSEAVAMVDLFPPILGQMISVGEETGKMDEVLGKLATYYESESENKVKALTTAIEPIIMVIMGVGVGFLVIAVIMPIYNLTSQF